MTTRMITPTPIMRSARGSTVLEFLIYIAVVGVTLTVVVSFLAEFSASQQKSSIEAEVAHNARFAVARLSADARDASSVNTGASTFGTSPGVLSLAMSFPALDPTVYTVSGGRLFVQQGVGTPIALTSAKTEVVSFILDNVSVSGKTRAIRIHLQLRNINPDNLVEQAAITQIETTVRLPRLDGFGS